MELPQQAELYRSLHSGGKGRCGRGPDAGPPGLCRHLQFNAFLYRAGRGGQYCLAGITRGNVLRVATELGIPARETTFPLTKVYSSDEAFVTGTFAGLIPVREVDGRKIGSGGLGPVTQRLRQGYYTLIERECPSGEISV